MVIVNVAKLSNEISACSLRNKVIVFFFFPICLQVHHGGAGTTAAGLKAAVMVNMKWSLQFLFIRFFLLTIYFNFCWYCSARQPSFRSLATNHFGEKESTPEA